MPNTAATLSSYGHVKHSLVSARPQTRNQLKNMQKYQSGIKKGPATE
jgi:hypothetical protein